MIVSIYDELSKITDQDKMLEAIRRISFYEMFEPLIIRFENWLPFVRYVLHAYSYQSDFISLGEDWNEAKRKVADHVSIPKDEKYQIPNVDPDLPPKEEYLFDALINLKVIEATQVISDYLQYQGNRDFNHLLALREAYQLFIRSPYRRIDDDQIYKNMISAKKLLDEILEFEDRIKNAMGTMLWDAKKEIDKVARKKTLSLEDRISK